MRFILRKYVDAETAQEALNQDMSTPVHDVYLKDGEEPKRNTEVKDQIGFIHPQEPTFGREPEPYTGKNR